MNSPPIATPEREPARVSTLAGGDASREQQTTQASRVAPHDSAASRAAPAAIGAPTPLDFALRYARRGWHVLPVKADKTPHTAHGFKDASTDEVQIRRWWAAWPDAQIGVACGPSGLVVVDLDVDAAEGKNGLAVFEVLMGTNAPWCELIAFTPRGGQHYVYCAPKGVEIKTASAPYAVLMDDGQGADCIDVRAVGGYILVPDGRIGRGWTKGSPFDGELTEPPEWLLAKLPKREKPTASPVVAGASGKSSSSVVIPIDTAWEAEIRSALEHIDAEPRSAWLAVGMALRSTGAGEQAFQIWDTWSQTCPTKYDAADQRRTWDSLAEYRDDGSEITLRSLFHLARESGWEGGRGERGVAFPDPGAAVTDSASVAPQSESGQVDASSAPAPSPTPAPASEPDVLAERVGHVRSLSEAPEPVAYLVRLPTRKGVEVPPGGEGDGFIRQGIAASLVGGGGAGKTMMLLDLAASFALGEPWLGMMPTSGAGHSFVVLAEEDHDEAHRRLWHLAEARGWDNRQRAEICKRVTVAGLRGVPNCGLLEAKKNTLQVTNFGARLKSLLTERAPQEGWGLLVLDPLSRLSGVELDLSNTNATAIVQVAEWLGEVPGRPTVLLGIHSSKASRRKGQEVEVRGPSGLTDGVRLEMTLCREGGDIFLQAAKNNYGPRLAEKGMRLTVGDHGVFERAAGTPLLSGDAEAAAAARRVAEECADYEGRVLAKLAEVGGAISKTAVCDAVRGKRGKIFAAWDRLVGSGRITNLGTSREKRFEVVAPAADGVCALSPPHPPVPGNRELGLEGPSPLPFPGDKGNRGEPSGNRELERADDGQPEKPKRRRARRKAKRGGGK